MHAVRLVCATAFFLCGIIKLPAADDTTRTLRPSTPLPALKGIEIDGRGFRLGESGGCRAVVIVFLNVECPIANSAIPRLNRLADKYYWEKVEFYGVISDRAVTRREAAAHQREYKIRFPMLFDASGELRAQLQPTHTPQAFVLSPQRTILYRGAIDSLADLDPVGTEAGSAQN